MRSSTGEHFVGLDHLRAVAVFLVFSWHFLNTADGTEIPLAGTFDLPVYSLFAEGHVGVSLFMVLSGYLFARLTQGRPLDWGRFYAARALRLLPLLAIVCLLHTALAFATGGTEAGLAMLARIPPGVLWPTLPSGGWSITVEAHFYLLFPLLLLIERRQPRALAGVLMLALLARLSAPWVTGASVQDAAYWTILGRIDQFVLGILFARYGGALAGRHRAAVLAFTALVALYAWFDRQGGFYGTAEWSGLWAGLLTVEGALCAVLAAWYDRSFRFADRGVGRIVARVGAASYSIYLLHVFVVFRAARWIDAQVIALDTFGVAMAACALSFVPVAGIGYLSWRHVELPFLRLRRPYVKSAPGPAAEAAAPPRPEAVARQEA